MPYEVNLVLAAAGSVVLLYFLWLVWTAWKL